jgi:basic amino acid/polyamine antiporter, APA family
MERDAEPPPADAAEPPRDGAAESTSAGEAAEHPTRGPLLTIERRIGAPRLFATAYSTVGSAIYFALGVVAAYALGMTPFVFLISGLLFVLTTMTYFEGMTAHPERGGSAVMARYAFNEFWSFVAGWAILLDYLILIAISTLSIGHYLTVFWSQLGSDNVDLAVAVVVLFAVARYNFQGATPRGRRTTALAIIDLALVLLIVVLGFVYAFDPGAVTENVTLGEVPKWSDLLFGTTIAVIAYTGIEAAANLAPEVRVPRRALRRTVGAGAAAVLLVFVGVSTVALMTLPVEPGIPVVGGQDSGYGTELGGKYVEAPVLGIVQSFTSTWVSDVLARIVGIVATLVLIQSANAGMVGITRTSYTLATHRQIPRNLARLHPRYTTPWIVISIACVFVFLLLLPVDIELLAGMFAYGALIAFLLAHLSVIAMRVREPGRPRPFKVPLNLRLRGVELPLPAAVGAVLSFGAWVGVLIYHDEARFFGSLWMLVGVGLYVIYRSRQGLSLTRMVEVSATTLASAEPEVQYGSILVPVFGEALDDDIMSTAGQLASEQDDEGEGGAVIEAVYVTEVPMSLPLNARLPEEKVEQARRALARAKQIGEQYQGVEVATAAVRGRTTGSTIVEEARRRGVEAIVIGAEPPSPIRGGGILGGVSGSRPSELGEVTAYVLEKSPCRVTAPPAGAEPDLPVDGRPDGYAGNED